MTIVLIIAMVFACVCVVVGVMNNDKNVAIAGLLFGIFLVLLGILIKLTFSN
jgi:hypothetical protein